MAGIVSFGAYIPPDSPRLLRDRGPARQGRRPRALGRVERRGRRHDGGERGGELPARLRSRERRCAASSRPPRTRSRRSRRAALIAKALDLRRDVRTADLVGSLRAGTDALHAAFDAVAAGSCEARARGRERLPPRRAGLRPRAGLRRRRRGIPDRRGGCVATFEGAYAIADEIVDVWRSEGDPLRAQLGRALRRAGGLHAGHYAKSCAACSRSSARKRTTSRASRMLRVPTRAVMQAAARALKLDAASLVEPLFGKLGNAGVAFAPLLLVAALGASEARRARAARGLRRRRRGDRLRGDGRTSRSSSRGAASRGTSRAGARSRATTAIAQRAASIRGSTPPAAMQGSPRRSTIRERDEDVAFKGQKCGRCGGVQFPIQRVCERCFAKDEFELVRLSDRTGTVVNYTFDFFFPTPDPPTDRDDHRDRRRARAPPARERDARAGEASGCRSSSSSAASTRSAAGRTTTGRACPLPEGS